MNDTSILMTPTYKLDSDSAIEMTRLLPSGSGIPTTCTVQKPSPGSLGKMPKNPFASQDSVSIEEDVERMMVPMVPLQVSFTKEIEVYDDAYPVYREPRERTA